MNPFLVALAVAPALIICFVIYRIDRYDKESHWQLIICFILGMLITLPAMQIEAFGESFGLNQPGHLGKLILLSFLVVGLTEELVKFVVLICYAYPRRAFNEPLDGIVYSVMISMGFATLENIIYADRFGLETTVLRAFTAVPAHAVFGVFMGYYIGLAKFSKSRKITLIASGVVLAAVVHGLYDFFILQEYYDWLMVFATLTLCVSLYFAIRLVRLHQANSPFRDQPSTETVALKTVSEIEEAEIIETNEITDEVIKEMKNNEKL